MFYSRKNFNRFYSIIRPVLVFALCAVAFVFSGCSPASVPVNGASGATDLNQDFRLVTNVQGVRMVSSETQIQPGDKTFSLGKGYLLVINANGSEIIPPLFSSIADRQLKLSAGDVLTVEKGFGRVTHWGSPLKPGPQDPNIHREALGGGFWLITGTDGSFILQ